MLARPLREHRVRQFGQRKAEEMASRAAAEKSFWDKVREVPPFLAATIAVAAALVGAGAAVVAYFATKAELWIVECVSEYKSEALSRQIDQITALNVYVDLLRRIQQMEREIADGKAIDRVELERLKDEKTAAWNTVQNNKESSDRALRFLSSGGCNKSDGILR